MSRRGSWGKSSEVSFARGDSFRERAAHSRSRAPEAPPPEEAGEPCACAEMCSGATVKLQEDGTRLRVPALTPRVFCTACETRIAGSLTDLPGFYRRMGAELGEPSRRGRPVRVPFGPRIPLREDLDALMRLTTRTLRGWEARTRAVPPAWTPPVQAPLDTPGSVTAAADTIGLRLGACLALQPGWMARSFDLHPGRRNEAAALSRELAELEAVHGDKEMVRLGVDFISLRVLVSGRDAGLEILHLHYRARSALGETRSLPESFDGIPCRSCGDIALERAEPPSDPKTEAMWSRCASCGHAMDAKTYRQWVDWYARWSQRADLPSCRRCKADRHAECAWGACPCKARGHAAAA